MDKPLAKAVTRFGEITDTDAGRFPHQVMTTPRYTQMPPSPSVNIGHKTHLMSVESGSDV